MSRRWLRMRLSARCGDLGDLAPLFGAARLPVRPLENPPQSGQADRRATRSIREPQPGGHNVEQSGSRRTGPHSRAQGEEAQIREMTCPVGIDPLAQPVPATNQSLMGDVDGPPAESSPRPW